MEKNLRQKVISLENICGTHVCLSDPVVAEILAYAGYDFIWIDTEHSSIDYKTLLNNITAVHAAGAQTIVRVSVADPNHVKRVLEMGPDGVIFPRIDTAEEADAAMRSCMYPPYGERGFGPLGAVHYGVDDINDYIKNANNKFCRFIQIESEKAVENLPEIIKNPYIDGYIFGPCDLSGSIGELGDVFGENTTALIRRAIAVLKAAGKCIGVSTGSDDPKVIEYWHSLGINMISAGSDTDYLLKSAVRNRNNIKEIFKCSEAALAAK